MLKTNGYPAFRLHLMTTRNPILPNTTITAVIPVYNEAENIRPLVEEFRPVRERLPGLAVLLVDDGSTDATGDRLDEVCEEYDWCRSLRLRVNRGQSAALLAGLRSAISEVLITLDGDGQNDPADIPALLAALDEVDVVCGCRRKRQDSWSKRWGSKWANRLRSHFTGDGIRDTGCSLKAFRSICVQDLPPLDGMHRFMPAWFRLHGRTLREIDVHHRPREFGASKYTNMKRLPRTVLDLIGYCWYRSRWLGGDAESD